MFENLKASRSFHSPRRVRLGPASNFGFTIHIIMAQIWGFTLELSTGFCTSNLAPHGLGKTGIFKSQEHIFFVYYVTVLHGPQHVQTLNGSGLGQIHSVLGVGILTPAVALPFPVPTISLWDSRGSCWFQAVIPQPPTSLHGSLVQGSQASSLSWQAA